MANYNTNAEVRSYLIGNIGETEIDETELTNAVNSANSDVNNYISRDTNLDNTDPDFGTVKGAERLLAASELVGGREKFIELSKHYQTTAYQKLDHLLEKNRGTSTTKPVIVGGTHRTFPLNPSSKINTISRVKANLLEELDSNEDYLLYKKNIQ